MCSRKKKDENRTIGDRYYAGELAYPYRPEDFDCPIPEKLPLHFFPRVKRLDYRSAIKADVSRVFMSAWSVIPRCWYIDAWFDCEKCGKEYCWSAKTQQLWFERFQFYEFAYPKLCPDCRKKRKRIAKLTEQYASMARIAILRTTGLKIKQQALELINEIEQLSEKSLTRGIAEKRDILLRQIEKMKSASGG